MLLELSLAAVFHRLAAPQRLGAWLPEIAVAPAEAEEFGGVGTVFGVRLQQDGRAVSGTGEVIAYEPPWSVAYRLVAGSNTHVVRLTCINIHGATRVSVHQADSAPPLAVDLSPLAEPDAEDS